MKGAVLSVFCRSVGPGGTTVDFYPTPGGLKGIWRNENCPYNYGGTVNEETYEASDGHNVSLVPWAEVQRLAKDAARWLPYQPRAPREMRPSPVAEMEWTAEEQEAVLTIAVEAEDPDAVIAVGEHIVASLRKTAERRAGA